jgi:hypothetical protein
MLSLDASVRRDLQVAVALFAALAIVPMVGEPMRCGWARRC